MPTSNRPDESSKKAKPITIQMTVVPQTQDEERAFTEALDQFLDAFTNGQIDRMRLRQPPPQ
jgi:hypothetical protein